MDRHAQQLVRLAELLSVSAGVLRDLLVVREFDGATGNLSDAADRLERIAEEVRDVGKPRVPLP